MIVEYNFVELGEDRIMCGCNDATYGKDGYCLSEDEAALLRRPTIAYANGMVPVAVVKACGLDAGQDVGSVSLTELMVKLKRDSTSNQAACTKCETEHVSYSPPRQSLMRPLMLAGYKS